MFTTIINDCRDDNARSRQESRISSHLETSLSFIGVDSDIEASMQLIDVLDASEGRPGIILVNVAPRGGHTTKWENGTPFCYFWYKKTLVVSSVDGFTLSGVKKYLGISEVQLLDTHTGAAAMVSAGFIDFATGNRIATSQFRSFDFVPRIAAFIYTGHTAPSTHYSLDTTPALPAAIWHIDSFGNCKTTIASDDDRISTTTITRFGTFPHVKKLRDVPDSTIALVTGSSGIHDIRCIEIMMQRGHAASVIKAAIGDDIFTEASHFTTATKL